jgi:type II pantothenate kinase
MQIAFDFGITNTDIACDHDGEVSYFSFPSEDVNFYFIEKLLKLLNLDTNIIRAIAVTGGKSSDLADSYKNIPIIKINEIKAIGYGAKELYKIKDSSFIVVSCGTGTACVAYMNNEFEHLGGISVGGGTLQGLSNILTGISNPKKIDELALQGTKSNLDALIGEVVNDIGSLHADITASNFSKGRFNTNFKDADIESSLSNMIGEVIGTISYLNALLVGVKKIYFIGKVSLLGSVKDGIDKRLELANIEGKYNDLRGFGNVIGAIAYLNANT